LKLLGDRKIVLEICPSSNIHTGVVSGWEQFRRIFSELKKYQVLYTVNTDGPEMLATNLINEYMLLINNKILTEEDLFKATEIARRVTFIKNGSV